VARVITALAAVMSLVLLSLIYAAVSGRSASATGSLEASPSASALVTPAASVADAAGSAEPGSTAPASATPRGPATPDPGEPGFVAGTEANPRVIPVDTAEFIFEPNVFSVQQGETITFDITNTGGADHEFKVGPMQAAFGDLDSAPEVAHIRPGATASLTYTFSEAGPYAIACHEPGHFEHGMFGFVDVIATTPYVGSRNHPRMIVLRLDDNLEFVPGEVSVTPGETILFVLANVGSGATHEFQLGPADRVALDQVDGQIVVEADKIEPLHAAYLTYTFGSVGPYAFACHEPGHYEAGMKGIIDLGP
jgi:uncharacterized cupredoxin-like copper-binding protein